MPLDNHTYNELLGVRSLASLLLERSDKLIKKEEKERGVYQDGTKKTKGLSKEQEAKIITKKRTGQIKKATASTAA